MEYENMEIDKTELKKQFDDKIRETGEYIEIHFIMGKDKTEIIPNINIHNVTIFEISKAIVVLDAIKQDLINQYPLAGMIAKMSDDLGFKPDVEKM